MDEAETVIRVRPGFQTHIPRHIFHALGVKEGEYVKIIVRPDDSP